MKKVFIFFIFCSFNQSVFGQNAGKIDSTFGLNGRIITGTSVGDDPRVIFVQKDGKILAAGGANDSFPAPSVMVIIRYNNDGSLDNSFGEKGIVKTPFEKKIARIWRIVQQSDGKIVVGGHANADFALVRYNTNGTLDTTFGIGGKVSTMFANTVESEILVMAIQTDGKIITAGRNYTKNYSKLNGVYANLALARYLPNGNLDSTFNETGKRIINIDTTANSVRMYSISIQNDNKIIIGGVIENLIQGVGYQSDVLLLKFNTNGSFDGSFGVNGILRMKEIYPWDVKILNNANFLVTTSTKLNGSYKRTLNRYTANGFLDGTFGTDGKVNVALGANILCQKNGKIILAGYDWVTKSYTLERYSENGFLDNSFGSYGQAFFAVNSIDEANHTNTLQNDEKLLVLAYLYGKSNRSFKIVRYTNDDLNKPVVRNPLFSIYPNPTNGDFKIDFNKPIRSPFTTTIFDIIGRCVFEKYYDIKTPIFNVNIEHLIAGFYVVNIHSDTENMSRVISKY